MHNYPTSAATTTMTTTTTINTRLLSLLDTAIYTISTTISSIHQVYLYQSVQRNRSRRGDETRIRQARQRKSGLSRDDMALPGSRLQTGNAPRIFLLYFRELKPPERVEGTQNHHCSCSFSTESYYSDIFPEDIGP